MTFVTQILCADSVTKAVSDADRKRIAELENIEVTLRDEVNKLKVGVDNKWEGLHKEGIINLRVIGLLILLSFKVLSSVCQSF